MDSIANMLTIIRNAQAANHESVLIPFSNLKKNIATILEEEKFVDKIETIKIKKIKYIKIFLKYTDNNDNSRSPAIREIKKISKSGQRAYTPYEKIRPYKSGYGIKIISTSKGLLTDKKARKQKIGGEVICSVF